MFDQRGELPLLPFGYPIGFVPASRDGVYPVPQNAPWVSAGMNPVPTPS